MRVETLREFQEMRFHLGRRHTHSFAIPRAAPSVHSASSPTSLHGRGARPLRNPVALPVSTPACNFIMAQASRVASRHLRADTAAGHAGDSRGPARTRSRAEQADSRPSAAGAEHRRESALRRRPRPRRVVRDRQRRRSATTPTPKCDAPAAGLQNRRRSPRRLLFRSAPRLEPADATAATKR